MTQQLQAQSQDGFKHATATWSTIADCYIIGIDWMDTEGHVGAITVGHQPTEEAVRTYFESEGLDIVSMNKE